MSGGHVDNESFKTKLALKRQNAAFNFSPKLIFCFDFYYIILLYLVRNLCDMNFLAKIFSPISGTCKCIQFLTFISSNQNNLSLLNHTNSNQNMERRLLFMEKEHRILTVTM